MNANVLDLFRVNTYTKKGSFSIFGEDDLSPNGIGQGTFMCVCVYLGCKARKTIADQRVNSWAVWILLFCVCVCSCHVCVCVFYDEFTSASKKRLKLQSEQMLYAMR